MVKLRLMAGPAGGMGVARLLGREVGGVLFDKDGTLIDFHASWEAAYRAGAAYVAALAGNSAWTDRLLRDGGYDPVSGHFAPGSLLALATSGEIAGVWGRAAGLDAGVHDLAHRLKEIFDAEATRAARPVVDLDRLFRRLRRQGMALGVATSDSTDSARRTMQDFGVDGLLDFVAGFDAGHGGKPGPGMVLGFCAATGLSPTDVAVIGDTLHDLEMARSAGAGLAVGVLTGITPRETLAELADVVLDSIADLMVEA